MSKFIALLIVAIFAGAVKAQDAPAPSVRLSNCVLYLNPSTSSFFPPTGTWSVVSAITHSECVPIHVAGMRCITPDPTSPNYNQQIDPNAPNGLLSCVRQAVQNMITVGESFGASPYDFAEVLVFVRNMTQIRPFTNAIQTEIWGAFSQTRPVHPPRTIIGETTFNGNYYEAGADYSKGPNPTAPSELVGDVFEIKGTAYVRASDLRRNVQLNYPGQL